jgi:nucleoid DNA-binding protein
MANEKMTWVELRKAVAQMAGTNEQEAATFLNALVDAIIVGLNNDQQVKLKGIGTFALKPMAARKSVNIATGEEFTIEGYNKLTFNAEANLKESVEKRIESPKTNELMKELNADPIKKLGEQANEIVDILADLGQAPDGNVTEEPAEEKPAKNKKKKANTTTEENVVEEQPVVVEEPAVEPTEQVEEEPAVEPVSEPSDEEPEQPTEKPAPKKRKCNSVCWVIILLILLGAGLYVRNYLQQNQYQKTPQPVEPIITEDSVITDSLMPANTTDSLLDSVLVACDSMRALVDSAMSDLEKAIAIDEYLDGLVSTDDYVEYPESNDSTTAANLENAVIVTSDAEETTNDDDNDQKKTKKTKLSLADQPRYYHKFIGVERVAQNSRLAWISKKYYGEKDLWVFIYEANRSIIKDPAYIRAGQHLRIPDLDEKYRNLNNPELQKLVDDLAEKYLSNKR